MSVPKVIKPHQVPTDPHQPLNRHRRQFMVQVTPYESLPSMMLDSHRGGGSWDVVPSQTDSIMTHQTVGGVSDAINLKGQMTASIKMSDEIWNPDAELTFSWTVAGCIADPTCKDSGQLRSGLPGAANYWQDTIPACPTLSDDINHSGPITFGVSQNWPNPFMLMVQSPLSSSGAWCNITVGRMSFVVNSSGSTSGGGSAGGGSSSAAGSPTVITTTDSHGSTIVTTSTPGTGTISGTTTGTSTATRTGNSTATGSVGITTRSDGIVLTTKLPQFSTLSNGSVVTLADPNSTSLSQSVSAEESANKAKMAGIVGGAVGGILLIVFVALLFWWRRKKNNRRWNEGNSSSTDGLGASSSTDGPSNPNVYAITTTAPGGWPGWQAHGHPHTLQSPPMYSEAPPLYQSPQPRGRRISAQNSGYYEGLGLGLTFHPDSGTGTDTGIGSGTGSDYHSPSHTGPSYIMSDSPHTTDPNALVDQLHSTNPPTSSGFHTNANDTSDTPNDELAVWAEHHRYNISRDLERRLRLAGYNPDFDPSKVDEEVWREKFGISTFELETVRRLYAARN